MVEPLPLALAAGLAALWFAPEVYARLRGVRGMTPGALKAALRSDRKDLVILDVRTEAEYRAGHVPGARHLPVDRLRAGLPLLEGMKEHEVVCVCASGKRSAIAAVRLKAAGFPTVHNLWGGMMFWGRDVEPG